MHIYLIMVLFVIDNCVGDRNVRSGGATHFHLWGQDPSWTMDVSSLGQFQWGRCVFLPPPPLPPASVGTLLPLPHGGAALECMYVIVYCWYTMSHANYINPHPGYLNDGSVTRCSVSRYMFLEWVRHYLWLLRLWSASFVSYVPLDNGRARMRDRVFRYVFDTVTERMEYYIRKWVPMSSLLLFISTCFGQYYLYCAIS